MALTTEQTEDLYERLHSLSKSLEGSGRIDEHETPEAYGAILDAMAMTRTAQQDEALIRQMLASLERVTQACDVAEYENALFSACEAATAARLRLEGKP